MVPWQHPAASRDNCNLFDFSNVRAFANVPVPAQSGCSFRRSMAFQQMFLPTSLLQVPKENRGKGGRYCASEGFRLQSWYLVCFAANAKFVRFT